MQSVFVIITKFIGSKHYFCKEFFCNNFGRDVIAIEFLSFFCMIFPSFPGSPTPSKMQIDFRCRFGLERSRTLCILFFALDGQNRQDRQSLAFAIDSRKPFRNSRWNKCYTNECQSRDSIRIAVQRTRGLWGPNSVFWGRYEHQRALVVRIAVITLASNSVIAIARFCPSKFFAPLACATDPKLENN